MGMGVQVPLVLPGECKMSVTLKEKRQIESVVKHAKDLLWEKTDVKERSKFLQKAIFNIKIINEFDNENNK